MNSPQVGLIGLGNMGFAMAEHLLSNGHRVLGYDINPESCRRFKERGGSTGKIAEIVTNVSSIILMLPNSKIVNGVVEEIIAEYNQLPSKPMVGLSVIDMSSSFPIDTQKNGQRLKQTGINMLDAPVSGGVKKAKTGELTIMIGGDETTVDNQRPLLETLGKNLFYVGKLGSGHTVKAVNNFLSASHLLATSEAVRLLTEMEIDPRIGVQAFNQSSGRSFSTEYKFPEFILPETYQSGFSLELLAKDVGLTKQIAEQLEKNTPLITFITDTYQKAKDELDDGVDHTEIFKFVSSYM